MGGKLAQVGARLIDGTAKKMADDFFTRFGEELANGDAVDTPPAEAAPKAAPAADAKDETPDWTRHAGWWALGGAIVLIALYLLVGR